MDFRQCGNSVDILQTFSKLLERILCKQVIEFMNTIAILPPFRSEHITTTALIKVANDIASAILLLVQNVLYSYCYFSPKVFIW